MTDEEFEKILDQAETLTNDQLKDHISSLTKLTDKDIQDLAPAPEDKTKLLQLMQIVRSAADDNDKKAQLLANIEMYAGIVLKVAAKFLV